MTRFRSTSLRSLALALACFACAPPVSADADSRLRVFGYTRALPVEAVPDSVIDDWKYLDDRNVMVFRNSQAYLLVLSSSCPALQSAGVIGFNAAISGLVAAKSLMVGSRNATTECGVDQVVRLERSGSLQSGPAAPPPRRTPAPASTPAPPAAAAPAPTYQPPSAPAYEPPATPAPTPAPSAPPPVFEPAPPPPPPLNDRPIATPPGATPL